MQIDVRGKGAHTIMTTRASVFVSKSALVSLIKIRPNAEAVPQAKVISAGTKTRNIILGLLTYQSLSRLEKSLPLYS